jgi:hypothetical protein
VGDLPSPPVFKRTELGGEGGVSCLPGNAVCDVLTFVLRVAGFEDANDSAENECKDCWLFKERPAACCWASREECDVGDGGGDDSWDGLR